MTDIVERVARAIHTLRMRLSTRTSPKRFKVCAHCHHPLLYGEMNDCWECETINPRFYWMEKKT